MSVASEASEASIANSNVFTFQFPSKSEIRFNSKKLVDNFTHFFFSQKLHKSIFGWFNKRLKRTKKTGRRVPREKCIFGLLEPTVRYVLSHGKSIFFCQHQCKPMLSSLYPDDDLLGMEKEERCFRKKAPSSKNRKLRRAYISLCLLSIQTALF